MIEGFLVSLTVLVIVVMITVLLTPRKTRKVLMIGAICCVLSTVIGYTIEVNSYREELAAYKATKEFCESTDMKVTQFEKTEFLKLVNASNREMAKAKIEIQAWWNFALPQELKIAYMEEKLIKVR